MAAWTTAGKGRWVREGDNRHLLLHVGKRYVEHHLAVVHVYDGPEEADLGNPLGEARWVATHDRADLADADLEALWRAMRELADE